MTTEATAALKKCMAEFGDLSGLVFNVRTGHMVTGHQRKAQLPAKAKLVRSDCKTDAVGTVGYGYAEAHGTRWPVRFVDWPESREKAANVAANSPLLAGSFDEGLKDLLAEIGAELPDLSKELRLDELILDPMEMGPLAAPGGLPPLRPQQTGPPQGRCHSSWD